MKNNYHVLLNNIDDNNNNNNISSEEIEVKINEVEEKYTDKINNIKIDYEDKLNNYIKVNNELKYNLSKNIEELNTLKLYKEKEFDIINSKLIKQEDILRKVNKEIEDHKNKSLQDKVLIESKDKHINYIENILNSNEEEYNNKVIDIENTYQNKVDEIKKMFVTNKNEYNNKLNEKIKELQIELKDKENSHEEELKNMT